MVNHEDSPKQIVLVWEMWSTYKRLFNFILLPGKEPDSLNECIPTSIHKKMLQLTETWKTFSQKGPIYFNQNYVLMFCEDCSFCSDPTCNMRDKWKTVSD